MKFIAERRAVLFAQAKARGMSVKMYHPGDGVTRYDFALRGGRFCTVRGLREAEVFILGWDAGVPPVKWDLDILQE